MNTFPLVEVCGDAYEMGYQHGTQAAALIDKYLILIEKMAAKKRDLLGRKALAFQPFIEKLNPLLIEEVRGLAAGAAISFAEAMLCQVRTAAASVEGCTGTWQAYKV
jgi:isopenicillin-N N-acyltransferase-like protein